MQRASTAACLTVCINHRKQAVITHYFATQTAAEFSAEELQCEGQQEAVLEESKLQSVLSQIEGF